MNKILISVLTVTLFFSFTTIGKSWQQLKINEELPFRRQM
jgi:hypothetical protein